MLSGISAVLQMGKIIGLTFRPQLVGSTVMYKLQRYTMFPELESIQCYAMFFSTGNLRITPVEYDLGTPEAFLGYATTFSGVHMVQASKGWRPDSVWKLAHLSPPNCPFPH